LVLSGQTPAKTEVLESTVALTSTAPQLLPIASVSASYSDTLFDRTDSVTISESGAKEEEDKESSDTVLLIVNVGMVVLFSVAFIILMLKEKARIIKKEERDERNIHVTASGLPK
jgi:hypothetical protein